MPIKIPELIAYSFQPAYVARGAVGTPADINRLKGYIRNAFEAQLNHEGYSMVEVMCSCRRTGVWTPSRPSSTSSTMS